MVFDVTTLTYLINGINYSSTATSVTLSNGDPSNPRFDAIVADEFGVVSVISGIPSPNPLTPTIPANQVLVQYVLVDIGATTPPITNEYVYRESQFGDWIGATSGPAPAPTASWASPTPPTPYGTACLLITSSVYTGTRYVSLTAPSPITRADYASLSLRVYLPQNFTTLDGGLGRKPAVMVLSGATSLGFRNLDQHGLNLSNVGTWQLVTIPLAFFNGSPSSTTITSIRLFLVESLSTTPPLVTIAYDDITFQTGFGTLSTAATIDIAENNTVKGSTTKLNFIDGQYTSTTVTNDVPNGKIDVQINSTINTGSFVTTSSFNSYTGSSTSQF